MSEDEISSKLLILHDEILTTKIKDEEVCDEKIDDTTNSGNDERPVLA